MGRSINRLELLLSLIMEVGQRFAVGGVPSSARKVLRLAESPTTCPANSQQGWRRCCSVQEPPQVLVLRFAGPCDLPGQFHPWSGRPASVPGSFGPRHRNFNFAHALLHPCGTPGSRHIRPNLRAGTRKVINGDYLRLSEVLRFRVRFTGFTASAASERRPAEKTNKL